MFDLDRGGGEKNDGIKRLSAGAIGRYKLGGPEMSRVCKTACTPRERELARNVRRLLRGSFRDEKCEDQACSPCGQCSLSS